MRPYELPDGGLIDLDKVAHVGPVKMRSRDFRHHVYIPIVYGVAGGVAMEAYSTTIYTELKPNPEGAPFYLWRIEYELPTQEQLDEAVAKVEAVRKPLIDAWTGRVEG